MKKVINGAQRCISMNRNQVRKEIADAVVNHSMYLLFMNRGLLLTSQIRYGSPKDSTFNVLMNTSSENYELHRYHKEPICIQKYLQLNQKQ
jgi:hypothetical protein